MQLHYQSVGKGQPIILLHGLFGSTANWGTIAKHFAATHEVLSVDLRNHGKSPHHADQTYQDMAADIAELYETLRLTSAHVIGHSLGGKVAMQFAADQPERIDKLVIVDMAMRAYADEHTHLIDAMLATDLTAMQSRTEVDTALSKRIPNAMIRQFLLMNLVKLENGLQWRINLHALKANYPALTSAVCEHTQYNKPSLFIRGERSHYVNDQDIAQTKQHFTAAAFTSLPTDHWVHAEQPQAFIDTVEQFLSHSA